MTRLTFERGRWFALFSWCACTPGLVLDTSPESGSGRSTATAPEAPALPPAAAEQGRADPDPRLQIAATAGRAALEVPFSREPAGRGSRASAPLPEHVFGVTLTDVSPLDGITQALGSLARKPTARVVFDAQRGGASYVPALRELAAVSYIMGELSDSVDVADVSIDAYAARTSDYLSQLGELVDIWEIGNDVNGEWLGPSQKVEAKITAAYELVAEQGKRTALTFNWNEGCVQQPDHELFTWAQQHVPQSLRDGLDFVWVSYYEQRCHRPEPDWGALFARLHALFPHAKLGIGGCGESDQALKAQTLQHFYTLKVAAPGFVGGYFWWYFREDMQPSSRPLWQLLNDRAAGVEIAPL